MAIFSYDVFIVNWPMKFMHGLPYEEEQAEEKQAAHHQQDKVNHVCSEIFQINAQSHGRFIRKSYHFD
jgi:hypothetical protein